MGIAIGLSLGAAVSLGFSRFAYALLLPPMRTALHWTYVEAGGLNTANAIGYIVGSATAAWFSKRLGIRATFLLSLLLSGLMLLGSGFVDTYGALAALRTVGGFSTAILFIIGASLSASISPLASHRRSALLIALYISGVGTGIVVSGFVVPPILARLGTDGWQSGWIWMGCLALLSLVPAGCAVRAIPPQQSRDSGALPWKETVFLGPTFIGYALYGAGYVSYMTFIILLLQQQTHGSPEQMTLFWIVLGLASVFGTLFWGRALSKIHDGKGPALISLVVLIGALPVLIWQSLPAAFVSAVIFGGSFMAGPSSVTILVRKLAPAHLCTAAIAAMTVAFAIGQAIGPIFTGYISDMTGSVSAGLWAAPALLIIGALIAPLQRIR
jgi:predicted MFS family arabinose efflux permease